MPGETEGEKYKEGKTKCKDIKMSPAIRFEAAILSPLHLKLGVLLELVPLLHQHELFLTNESEISNRFTLNHLVHLVEFARDAVGLVILLHFFGSRGISSRGKQSPPVRPCSP